MNGDNLFHSKTENQPEQFAPAASETDLLSRRTMIVLGIGAGVIILLVFLWRSLGILSLLFTSILLAILLRSMSNVVRDRLKISDGWALTIIFLLLIALAVLFVVWLSPLLMEQFNQLEAVIPKSLHMLEREVAKYEWGEQIYLQLTSIEGLLTDKVVLDQLAGIFSTTLGGIGSFIFVIIVAIYLAVDPQTYIKGILSLIPLNRRARYQQVLTACKTTLQWWLFGRALSMLAVGVMVSITLWLMGIRLALALGILAALFDFIPNIGPVLATAPAVLIAFMQSPLKGLYILILYFIIQQVESFLITPIIQQKTVKLPPALSIVTQLLLTFVLGAIGLVIASPLLAIMLVVIRMIYIEDFLGDNASNL